MSEMVLFAVGCSKVVGALVVDAVSLFVEGLHGFSLALWNGSPLVPVVVVCAAGAGLMCHGVESVL